jgi:hypothetical protein
MNANGKMLILFVILLLGLVLCSFLGGKRCVEGFEEYVGKHVSAKQNSDGSIVFTGSDGKTVTLTKKADGSYTGPNGYTATIDSNGKLIVKTPDNKTVTTTVTTTTTSESSTSTGENNTTNYDDYNHYSGASSTTYYGPNGGTAKVTDNGGQGKVVIVNTNGYTKIYYIKKDNSTGSSGTATGSNGGTATMVTDNNGRAAVKITLPDGTSTLYTINYNGNPSVDNTINQYDSTSTNTSGSDYNNAYVYTGPNGNTAVTGPNGNTAVTSNSSTYYSSLPPGIPANQIPVGQEDLYILKSQVVPPVCPKCPDPIVRSSENQDNTKCPPCPPCARCPEPAFDCKKVPNYNAFNQSYLPVPVLTDFSGFGM